MARHSLRRTRPRLIFVPAHPRTATVNTVSTGSIEDALKLILQGLQGERISDSSFFDGRFNINIKLTGEQWNGEFNYHLAEFVLQIQREIVNIFNKYSDKKINFASLRSEYSDLIVSVRVSRGCTNILVKLENILKYLAKIVDGMESKDKLKAITRFSICVLAGTAFIYGAGRYFDTQIKIAEINAQKEIKVEDEKTKQHLAEIIHESKKIVPAAIAPMEHLAKQMHGSDTMKVGDTQYSKPQAEETYRTTKSVIEETTPKTFKVDGEYDITSVDVKKGSITASKDGVTRQLNTRSLSEDEKTALHTIYREAEIANTYPRKIGLQVNVMVKDGEWGGGMVMGLGDKRSGSISIKEALERSRPRKTATIEQASLFPHLAPEFLIVQKVLSDEFAPGADPSDIEDDMPALPPGE